MILINMEMPVCCDECPLFDFDGDYPTCTVNSFSSGYNFPVKEKRMSFCPLHQLKTDELTSGNLERNVLATLETIFSESKDELKELATRNLLSLFENATKSGVNLEQFEEDLRRNIASAVSDKMLYMNTCLNERDIILRIIKADHTPSALYCDVCESEYCSIKSGKILEKSLSKLHKSCGPDGQEYVQLYDVLETVHRFYNMDEKTET